MQIFGRYSLRDAEAYFRTNHAGTVAELDVLIGRLDGGQLLARPRRGRSAAASVFTSGLRSSGWQEVRVECSSFAPDFVVSATPTGRHLVSKPKPEGYRVLDFVRDRVAVEVGFDSSHPRVYSGCAKMTIFHKLGFIDAGIEVVPLKTFADHMSTGVSFFEQIVWDLEHRGGADIDIPVLVLGIG